MRSEPEMMELILGVAAADERIRAVIMNGSRANPDAPRDPFQDYDIVYVVTSVEPFVANLSWIERFGERMILQMPDQMGDAPPEFVGFAYLMQFADGNRIDLTIVPIDRLAEPGRDSLSVLLLDKDGVIAPFDPPSDRDYLPRPPTAKQFDECCNEFWWVAPYVAKGLWRQEIVYAKSMQEEVLRPQLLQMLEWYVGVRTGFARSPGKAGKYLQQWLEPELWAMLVQSYADADYGRSWDALLVMAALFRRVAGVVAEHFGYAYPHEDDRRVSAHLLRVRQLPRDASELC